MSRCFPFPPPGYEKKDWAENVILLAKEKRKDKKHKKEKREKEKKEHAEKKDKDHSEVKHKEKKDQNEKRKDRKKDKDRYKGRTPEDSLAEERTECYNELHIQESWEKAEEGKDSKFAEELGRRTRDDGEANRMVGCFTRSIERKIGVGAASASLEKERVADKKMFPVHNSSGQRRNNGSGLPIIDNVASSLQRTTGSISPATSTEKESGKIHEKLTVGSDTEQNRNHRISQPMESSICGLVDRKNEFSTTGMEKKRFGHKNVVSYSIAPTFESGKLSAKIVASNSPSIQRRNDGLGLPLDNLSSILCKAESMANSSAHSRIGGMGFVSAVEKKERAKSGQLFPHPVISEQKKNTSVGQTVEVDRYQNVERKDKNAIKKAEDRKGVEDRDQSEKSKTKEERHSKGKKKREKIANKDEDIEHDKLRNFGKKDQVNTLNSKILAPHKGNTTGIIGVDGTTKKRKDLETNGFLHENDAWPNKIARMTSSTQPLVNGRTMEMHIAVPCSPSLKNGAMNNLKPDSILVNKESKINGTAKSQQLPVYVKPPVAGGLTENGEFTLKLPHPDSKYLSQMYTVPKMEEWPDVDDQDWLFNCCDSQQKLKIEPEAENAPQVWAEVLQIDSADDFALPYVVLF